MRRSVTVRRTAMVRTWISVLCVALHMLLLHAFVSWLIKGTLGCVAIEVANSPLRSQELIATSRCTWTMAAAACCHPDEASICRHCTVPHEKTAPKDLGVVMFAAAQDASTGAPAKHQVRGCSSHSRRRG